MIPEADFLPLVRQAIPRFQATPPQPPRPDEDQSNCILHPPCEPLMIVAGPGSGKTTVLVLRALRLVFVEGYLPERVVLTTFTRKAAAEMRSRLIEWGALIVNHLRACPPSPPPDEFVAWLDSIDVNRFVTGTLDSICEDALGRYRDPADPVVSVVEGFVADALLTFHGLFPHGARGNPALNAYLSPFTRDGTPPANFGEVLRVSRSIVDRAVHDLVDLAAFRSAPTHAAARQCLGDAIDGYRAHMAGSNQLDFALLEESFLQRLSSGRLTRFCEGIAALLVDEYQDTNPLQEAIYFELVRQTGASLTVVGDDDQSLYRFRGATVELFQHFVARYTAAFPNTPAPAVLYLANNYRSTPEIVAFFNDFAQNDPDYQGARVKPPSYRVIDRLPSNGLPILGMFRPDADTLADDLAGFLHDVFRGAGRTVTVGGTPITIRGASPGGDFGDSVLLSHTVNEYASRFGNNPPRTRLPRLLRDRLWQRFQVNVFNPRGRALRDTLPVQRLLGVMLDCIDPPNDSCPNGVQQEDLRTRNQLRGEALTHLDIWRQAARAFLTNNPAPNAPHTLQDFVQAWQTRTPQAGGSWPGEWPLLELCFKIVTWMPELHDNPEGQVYLEAIARCLSQGATFSSYRATVVFNQSPYDVRSVNRAIQDIFAPLAESAVEIDEDIMPHVPRDWFPLMTIHQAKGLEFPLVILDVSSDYKTNHRTTKFRRFPEAPSSVQQLEDDLAPFCGIGPARTARPGMLRTFDDLIRLYYVAFSRAQNVLLLVGLMKCIEYNTTIRHVGTWWRQDESWAWRSQVPGQQPPHANNMPLTLI